mmetsp:Transcript_5186/g.7794  ORF Transcript_5186/g.7794 Transcript_5186/m.7794 type:complete len:232 (-) Transcript_5186:227-922(-)
MGAGASVGDVAAKIPQEKMSYFVEKLVKLEDLTQRQKDRLLDQMQYELKKVMPQSEDEKALAAQKIQAISRGKAGRKGPAMGSGENLEEVFTEFCKTFPSKTVMTNAIWAKFCKDSKLLDKSFNRAAVDMSWSKVAGKERTLNYEGFLKLLEEVASRKDMKLEEVHGHVLENAKVSCSATKGSSRFYDDKASWTGTATKGGPTNVDAVTTLEGQANRDNKADARGVVQQTN